MCLLPQKPAGRRTGSHQLWSEVLFRFLSHGFWLAHRAKGSGTPLLTHEKFKISRGGQCPTHHAKEGDKVGLANTVGTDKCCQATRREILQRLNGLEALESYFFEIASHAQSFSPCCAIRNLMAVIGSGRSIG